MRHCCDGPASLASMLLRIPLRMPAHQWNVPSLDTHRNLKHSTHTLLARELRETGTPSLGVGRAPPIPSLSRQITSSGKSPSTRATRPLAASPLPSRREPNIPCADGGRHQPRQRAVVRRRSLPAETAVRPGLRCPSWLNFFRLPAAPSKEVEKQTLLFDLSMPWLVTEPGILQPVSANSRRPLLWSLCSEQSAKRRCPDRTCCF